MSVRPAPQTPPLEQVLADHRAGRLEAAEAGYVAILDAEPDHPDALHLLGVAALQAGRTEEAVAFITRAIERHPVEGIYFCNLGEALRTAGRLDEAEAALRQALALDPRLAEAHNNLGLTLRSRRRDGAARQAFLRALALNPHLVDAEINLASALAAEGEVVEASERLERVLRLDPDNAVAHYNLGNLLRDQGLHQPAVTHYRAALARHPTFVAAWNNLGLALQQLGDEGEASAAFEAALRLAPDHPEALNNLGLARLRTGDLVAARTALERAIALAPSLASPRNHLGTLLRRGERIEAAVCAFRAAVALDPHHAEAHANLVMSLLEAGRTDDAVASWRAAVRNAVARPDLSARLLDQLRQRCRFDLLPEVEATVDADTASAVAEGDRPGETPLEGSMRRLDPAFHQRLATAWARDLQDRASRLTLQFDHSARRDARRCGAGRRLRVGWLWTGRGDEATARLRVEVLEAHDPAAVEIIVYADGDAVPAPVRARIGAAAGFVDLQATSDRCAARRIYADEIDILVDLAGDAGDERALIPALRPAPVQVRWLGMPGTTGGSFIDYLLADPVCVPVADFEHFSERIVHLPGPCLPLGAVPADIDGCRRSEAGLPDAAFVFVSFADARTIEPVMFEVWMRLLGEVPESVLWLQRGCDEMVASLRREADARGVAGRRLVFAGGAPHEALQRLRLADLALDTRIYNGGAATGDALRAGLPVVGLIGSHVASRLTASALTSLGLGDLLAYSLDDYLAKALALASSPADLAATKARLARALRTRSLVDPDGYARALERAYGRMWDRHARGLPPESFAVPPCATLAGAKR